MRVIPLGTSAGKATAERMTAAFAIQTAKQLLLLDCGEGTQHQMRRAALRPHRLSLVCISHLHGDHLHGLPALLGTLSLCNRQQPLTLIGPPGLATYLDTLRSLQVIYPDFPIHLHECGTQRTTPFTVGDLQLTALPLQHRIACFGFRITEHPCARLDAQRLQDSAVPHGPCRSRLRQGQDVNMPDGRILIANDFLRPIPSCSVTYCTDTAPCENTRILAQDADLLIHEATYANDAQEQAHQRGHSTVNDAARCARAAQVKRLLLTHFSPRYDDLSLLLAQARAVFPHTDLAEELQPIEVCSKQHSN